MSQLAEAEVRRLMKYLRGQIGDVEKLSFVEDELCGEFGAEFLRESDILSYFSNETIDISVSEKVWKLNIISYTQMRMTQRGIKTKAIAEMFEKFLLYCADRKQVISIGAYTIFGKTAETKLPITLRIDVDEPVENENRAHTVTVFIGRTNPFETVEINLIS